MVTSPRASARSYRIAPPAFYGDVDQAIEAAEGGDFTGLRSLIWQLIEWQRLSAEVIELLTEGKDNATGTVTLTTSITTTTLSDRRIAAETKVILIPLSAASLADIPWQTFPNVTEQQAVLNHASDPGTRDFAYCLRG